MEGLQRPVQRRSFSMQASSQNYSDRLHHDTRRGKVVILGYTNTEIVKVITLPRQFWSWSIIPKTYDWKWHPELLGGNFWKKNWKKNSLYHWLIKEHKAWKTWSNPNVTLSIRKSAFWGLWPDGIYRKYWDSDPRMHCQAWLQRQESIWLVLRMYH